MGTTEAGARQAQIVADIRSHLSRDDSARLSDREVWHYAIDHGPNTPEGHAVGLTALLSRPFRIPRVSTGYPLERSETAAIRRVLARRAGDRG